MPTIVIATPSLAPHDAIGNDVLIQQEILQRSDLSPKPKVVLYAEHAHSSLKHMVIDELEVFDHLSDPNNILIYHHSIYWQKAERFYALAQATIIMKYHNITPAQHFKDYDPIAAHYCTIGRKQTERLVKSRLNHVFLADSSYNASELIQAGANPQDVHTLAPFMRLEDFDQVAADETVLRDLSNKEPCKVVFVGRMVPNKGHKHLIRTIARYIKFYGKNIHLYLVGSFSPALTDYYRELENEIEELDLSDAISFKSQVSFAELKAYYTGADVFLCCSEHEGFCVPLLEAQKLNLPVVAVNRGAVQETLGEGQICVADFDYNYLAAAIHRIKHQSDTHEFLVHQGAQNLHRFKIENLEEKFLDLCRPKEKLSQYQEILNRVSDKSYPTPSDSIQGFEG